MNCSIIIPTHNRGPLLRQSLKSLADLTVPEGMAVELLVVDNASTDDTAHVVEQSAGGLPFPVRYLVEKRLGASHARNRAILEASHEHLVFLDDDMLVDPGWLEAYAKAQASHQPDAVVGPVEPWHESDPQTMPWLTPRMLDFVTSSFARKGDRLRLLRSEECHEVSSCNFAVRRQVAIDAGGFNTSLDRSGRGMLAGGDTELGEKLGLLGKRIAYVPGCRIRHFISRHKVSPEGLRSRWRGLGATQRALMDLRGERLATARNLRLHARMIRLAFRGLRARLRREDREALRWELEALWLRGLLHSPVRLPRRAWPPVPLTGDRQE